MARLLVIKAKGGLGNRMLSAVTGLALAEIAGRTPVIDWRDGMYAPRGVNAYPLLFDSAISGDAAALDARTDVTPAIWAGALGEHPVDVISRQYPDSHSSPFIYRKLCTAFGTPADPTKIAVFWSYLPKLGRLRERWRRVPRLAGMDEEAVARHYLAKAFTPNATVLDAVKARFEGVKRPLIGVHVRYTDRKISLTAITKALRGLRAKLPDSPIFLATDNAVVQAQIMGEFDNVIIHAKFLPEDGTALHLVDVDPVREAEAALVDMWSLAQSDWLIHSKHSTFSVTAALIGGIPAARQIDVDRFNPKVVLKRIFQRYA